MVENGVKKCKIKMVEKQRRKWTLHKVKKNTKLKL